MSTTFEQLEDKTLMIFRLLGLIFAILPVFAITLIKLGYLHTSSYTEAGYWFSAVGLIALGLLQFFWLPESEAKNKFYLAAYNIFGVSISVFVAGFDTLFIMAWLMLVIATDANFGRRAGIASYVLFISSLAVWRLLHPEIPLADFIGIAIEAAFIGCIALVVSHFRENMMNHQKELEQSHAQISFQRERLLALVNSMGDPVIATDDKGVINMYNAALLNLLDIQNDLTGKNIDQVFKFRDAHDKKVDFMAEVQKTNNIFSRTDLTHHFGADEKMRLYINVAPIRPGYQSEVEHGFIFVIRDITKEKTLEDEREEFISVVSHELRTPVAIVEGNLSNLRVLKAHKADSEVLDHAIDDAHEQAKYLAKMINDLSTLSEAEKGANQEAEDLDVGAILRQLYDEYQPQASEQGLQFKLDIAPSLPTVRIHKLYLTEVIQNFVNNALKYTKTGSVTLSAKLADDSIDVSVEDTGIGISRSDQHHLFEKFYRSEDYRTRESSGAGLGLYIAKKLAERIGVKIYVKSELNKGSVFGVSISTNHKSTSK